MSTKRKLEDFLPQQGLAHYQNPNYPHVSVNGLPQFSPHSSLAASFHEEYDCSFDDSLNDSLKRRCCREEENPNLSKPSHFSVSSTSAFHSTSHTHRTLTVASSSMNMFAVSQKSLSDNFHYRPLGNDEGVTDLDNTPASLNNQQSHFKFSSQCTYQPQSLSHGLAMDIEEVDSEFQDCAMHDDGYDSHSLNRVAWFDRIRRNRTNRTAENVLNTSRHYAFPPTEKPIMSNNIPSHPDSICSSLNQTPAASCMYCLRQFQTAPVHATSSMTTTAGQAGGYLSCHYCDRMCCAETCLRLCELCHGLFCGVCSTTNYQSAYERYLCLECHQRSN